MSEASGGTSSSDNVKQPKELTDIKPPVQHHRVRRRDDLIIKLLYMTYSAAIGIISPFMPVYFASLGHGGQIIGLIGSITPITTVLVGPIWGLVSDRSGSTFLILYMTITTALVCQILIGISGSLGMTAILVCLKAMASAPVSSLIDSLVLKQLDDRSQFGKVRLWSILGSGVATGLSGRFVTDKELRPLRLNWPHSIAEAVELASEFSQGYRFLFLAHALFHVPVFMALHYFQKQVHLSEKQSPRQNLSHGETNEKKTETRLLVSKILRTRDSLIFFASVLTMGMAGGLAENFTYVRFREIGGSGTNMGISRFLSSLGGAIMFYNSRKLGSMLGAGNVIALSLLTVAIRFALIATMATAGQGYVAEALRGASFGTFWSTATVFVSHIFPDEASATMLQLLNVAYNGAGRSLGAILGGKIQANVGTAETFHLAAIAYTVLAVISFAYHKFYDTPELPASNKKKQ